MAGESDLLKNLRQQYGQFDEGALEALTSKGLVRRARKDLSGGANIEIVGDNGSELQLRVIDATVTLTVAGPAKARCSCPATEVCRHILIATFWLIESAPPTSESAATTVETTNSEVAAEVATETIADQLLKIEIGDLIKWAGKKGLRNGFSLLIGNQAQIATTGNIIIRFPDLNISCRYFFNLGLAGMLCSCQASQVCHHLVAAVLAYQRAHGVQLIDSENRSLVLAESDEAPRSRSEIISTTERLLQELIEIGICHLSDASQQRFATLAVSALGVNLPRLSHGLRAISEEIALSLKRDARADDQRLLSNLARAYALTQALTHSLQSEPRPDLIGRHRSHYEEIGSIELHGVGAYHWQTRSGYAGLTVLFWDNRNGQWYNWSQARPTFHGQAVNPLTSYLQAGPWAGVHNPAQASRSQIKLIGARKNYQNRLSSSTRSQAILIGRSEPAKLDFRDRIFSDWLALTNYAASITTAGLNEYDLSKELVVIKPTVWGERKFHPGEQVCYWLLFDQQNNGINLRVPYSEINAQRIRHLEQLDPARDQITAIVGQLIGSGSRLTIFPISLFSDSVINLSYSEDAREQPPQTTPETNSETTIDNDDEEELSEIESPPSVAPAVMVSPVMQRIARLRGDLQALAEHGCQVISASERDDLTSAAKYFQSINLGALSKQIQHLTNQPTDRSQWLLRSWYLTEICLSTQ